MNIMKIITMGMTFYNLNKGLAGDGKKIMDEGTDVLQTISAALKDGKITNAEKEVIVEDFLATVFQHELDHLFGFLYVDRLNSTKDLVFEEELTNIASEKLLD